jgi:phosphopantothenoylcysteine decarboxylase/phosphopantothenate--cysteine ligase
MSGSHITVGVCGGVAAYKAVELVRALQNAGFDPHVAMTAAAEEFVRPLTFAAISGHDVMTSLWTGGKVPGDSADSSIEHIEEAQTTGALVVAPATANTLGKMAQGLAEDFLTTLYLALPSRTPVIVAPAMNVAMWEHPAVQANVGILRDRGVIVIEPDAGYLACGMVGSGRLAEIPAIVAAVVSALTEPKHDLKHETVLVTAGGTREAIDAVRFLGNRSSGRMGYALAETAARRGARVMLISAATGLPVPAGVELCPVTTAAEMHRAVVELLPQATIVLKAAAVADYRPVEVESGKLARNGRRTLELEPTEDIAADIVRRRNSGTLVIAFSAEVGEGLERARDKMRRKGVDAMVVNDISAPGVGFDSVRNAGTMLVGDRAIALPEMSKLAMAERILDEVAGLRRVAVTA